MCKKGYKFSAETLKRMSLAKLGKPGHPHTAESKRKLSEANRGSKSWRWKGGRKLDNSGYVRILMPDHPNAYKEWRNGKLVGRYVAEHRYVMSQILGRPLDKFDIVHHINGIKTDNRRENLQHLRSDSAEHHIGAHPTICPKCGHRF